MYIVSRFSPEIKGYAVKSKNLLSPYRSTEKGDIRYCNRENAIPCEDQSHGVKIISDDSVSSFDLTGTKATGANIHRLGRTADDSLNSSDVRFERSVFLAVRVRNGATERNALSAYTALCHVTDTSCELRLS